MEDNKRLRVAFFLPDLGGGGAERVILNVANGFVSLGHSVDLIVGSFEGPLIDQIPANVNVVDLHRGRLIECTWPLALYLRNKAPDLLISSLIHANIVALVASIISQSRTRIIITVHNNYSTISRIDKSIKWKLSIGLARLLFEKSDAIVAVSEGVANDAISHLRLRDVKVEVIYNPVLTPEFFEKLANARKLRDGRDSIRIVAVGRLIRQKDYPTLLKAISHLREKRQVNLTILGEGPDREKLENQIQVLEIADCVSLPGFVTNVCDYLVGSDLFVLSSIHEGLPTVLIEALAADCRIVSTDCPSGPDELLKSGQYGTLVPVGDPNKLCAGIEVELNQKRENRQQLSHHLDQFSLSTAVNKYTSVCATVLKNSDQ